MLVAATTAGAESGHDAWLRYEPKQTPAARAAYNRLPATVVVFGRPSPVVANARDELVKGLRGLLGREVTAAQSVGPEGAFVVGTEEAAGQYLHDMTGDAPIGNPEGFRLKRSNATRAPIIAILGGSDRGALYGVFAVLRHLAVAPEAPFPDGVQRPSAPLRWVNHWDNLDGSIERGYGGRSIFFDGGEVRQDLTLAGEYARLLASVGVNAACISSVNANIKVISDPFLPGIARVADDIPPVGCPGRGGGRLQQPEIARRARHVRSARSRASPNSGRHGWRRSIARSPISPGSS